MIICDYQASDNANSNQFMVDIKKNAYIQVFISVDKGSFLACLWVSGAIEGQILSWFSVLFADMNAYCVFKTTQMHKT